MVKSAWAVASVLSVAWTLKAKVPARVGVPRMTPLSVFNVRPSGNCPDASVQVYGAVPFAVNVAR